MKFILFCFTLIAACNPQVTESAYNTSDLTRCWKYSYEDNEGDALAYRPCDYDFPPSRGREGMTLRADNTFTYQAIAPTDGYRDLRGTWTLDDSTLTLQHTKPESRVEKFTLISLTAEKMQLKKL